VYKIYFTGGTMNRRANPTGKLMIGV